MADLSKIVLVAEAGGRHGYGHLHRLKTLAQHLKDEFRVHFFILKSWSPELQQELLQDFGGEVFDHYASLPGILKAGDILVWDGYSFSEQLVQSCKALGTLQVFWDDFLHPKPLADLIINAAPCLQPSQLSGSFHTRNLAGHRWFPLQAEFKTNHHVPRISNSLFICFGGSDPLDFTAQALFQASHTVRWSKITVVTGPGYTGMESLKTHIKTLSQGKMVDWYQAVDALKMAQLMQASEFALVPSSSVAYEALHSGCKVLTGAMVDNQELFHKGLVREGWVIDAGHFKEKETEKALLNRNSSVKPFPKRELANQAVWVKVFRLLTWIPQLEVRKAGEHDLSLTFSWASHPEVRKYAFDSRLIPVDEHRSWFFSAIRDVNKCYLIFSIHGKDLGSCRFDIQGPTAKISYLLDPNFQGQGYGLPLLQAALAYLEKDKPHVEEISGEVLEENIASIRIFETLGFKMLRTENAWLFLKRKK